MKSASVTVTTSPTLLIEKDDKNRYVYIHIVGNSTVYLGASNVATTTGLATEKHTSPLEFFLPINERLYGIVASGTEDVQILTPDLD
jgi:hypothetical protein